VVIVEQKENVELRMMREEEEKRKRAEKDKTPFHVK